MKYESLTSYGIKVMVNVKVFINKTDVEVDTRAMTLDPQTYVPAR